MHAGELIAGRYRLDDRIDGGAMGDVWRGHDTRLNRTVAIKLLRSGLSDDARFRARFQHEAQAVASLQAPGVVSLYDYGEDSTSEGIVSYLIMELVKGRSLAAILDQRGTLPPADTMRLIAAAGEALHAAHYAGIVHRDVKPGNMLVDADGNVKIVDFGIARARGEAGLTETGMVMGTLSYCSPEQLCDRELTPASDVYSLGIVAYECLSGRVPFTSSNPGAAINGHLHQPPPPLPNHIPPAVRDVVMRALEKDPNRRWRSAAAFAEACLAARSGRTTTMPVAAPTPPPAATRVMGTATPSAPSPPRTTGHIPVSPPRTQPHRAQPQRKEPKKSGAGVAVAVTAVLAGLALLIALLILRPWEGDPGLNANEPDATSTTGTTETEDTSEPPQGDDEAEPDPGNNGGNNPEEPKTGIIPPLFGKDVPTATNELNNAGFKSIRFESADEDSPTPCLVESVDPTQGEEVELDEQIEIVLTGTEEACPGVAFD
ncbi:serine/threonine protein kinase [Stackebrandtia soli]|uniref:serine/threonine-protein kinase n=1 Tax=Stackebrandtia soli TaxID=1892856 RepID=UPI0039EC2751